MTLALGLVLHGVVDQVDAGIALVEWEGRAFGTVALDALGLEPREGDRLRLRLRRRDLRVADADDDAVWLAIDLSRARAARLARPSTRARRAHLTRRAP